MKTYIIKKYVRAASIEDAIRREKKAEVFDIYTEERPPANLTPAIGFSVSTERDYDR
jgi:hypothetical protein